MKTIKIIEQAIIKEHEWITTHKIIAEILAKHFNGKKITRRIVKYIKAELTEGAVVHYSTDYDQCNIIIWGCFSWSYDNRISHFIGYKGDMDEYDPAIFEDRDARHGRAAIERNRLRSEMTDTDRPEQLDRAIARANRANAAFYELLGQSSLDTPDRWTIERQLDTTKG
jgi:hypothetical protein